MGAGLPLRSGLITPYRGVHYHLNEYSRRKPQNANKLFNYHHASLRNVIERGFSVIKKRFPIIASGTEPHYSFEIMTEIVFACYMIHNFLMSVNPYENLIAEVDRELMDAEADHHIGTSGLPTDVDYRTEFMLREQIASQMWNDYHNNFEFNWANEVTDNNMNSPDPSLHSQGTSSRGSKCKASMMEMLEKQYERLNSGIKRVSKVLERGNAIAEKSLTILESG
ncbi:hypothetical protein GH714_033435 [Hevea brasiliensis]|uniref:DDE Tnp4 domain-containing protein n=1 Tax=Hevea brasiliensis TaxID=3981 RepID=A0A6A6NC88_HEVBR|nr:hypothetical protein GH714_033435 [Hevea brasiliensis]